MFETPSDTGFIVYSTLDFIRQGRCNCQDSEGRRPETQMIVTNPLYVAVNHHQLALCRSLLAASSPVCVNQQTQPSFYSPLHAVLRRTNASEVETLGLVELLLRAGANVDLADDQQLVPLHLAVAYEFPMIIKRIIEANAKLDVRACDGATPLLMAVRMNRNIDAMQVREPQLDNDEPGLQIPFFATCRILLWQDVAKIRNVQICAWIGTGVCLTLVSILDSKNTLIPILRVLLNALELRTSFKRSILNIYIER